MFININIIIHNSITYINTSSAWQQVHPDRLAGLNPRLRGLQVGDFGFARQPLHLGDLSGNLFDIILRNVQGRPADIALAADALKASGFINYFGLQRFGNEGAPTHKYGLRLRV